MTFHNRYAAGGNQTQAAHAVRSKLDRPIVLLGLLGSGKTRLGRMLARALDVAFYDCDAELELSAGRSTREVYEQIGSQAYEQAENRILKRLIAQGGLSVIASGGGAGVFPDVFDEILAQGIAIWVRADLNLMLDRTTRGVPRPQLAGRDPLSVLVQMMETYHPVYAGAHVTVDSHDGPPAEVLNQTLFALNVHLDKTRRNP